MYHPPCRRAQFQSQHNLLHMMNLASHHSIWFVVLTISNSFFLCSPFIITLCNSYYGLGSYNIKLNARGIGRRAVLRDQIVLSKTVVPCLVPELLFRKYDIFCISQYSFVNLFSEMSYGLVQQIVEECFLSALVKIISAGIRISLSLIQVCIKSEYVKTY